MGTLAIGVLQRIPLHAQERIGSYTDFSGTKPFAIHPNGSLELIRPLNYEVESGSKFTVQIQSPNKCKSSSPYIRVATWH